MCAKCFFARPLYQPLYHDALTRREVVASGCRGVKACQSLGWIFVEQRMVVTGKPSKVQESLPHRHVCDRCGRRVAASQNGMNATKPAEAQKRDRSYADGIVESAMQRPS